MAVNAFKQEIVFQSAPTAKDSRNQPLGDWTNEATKNASVQMMSGNELTVANKTYPQAKWKVRLWYDSGLALVESWRISWGSKTFEINSIENEGQDNKFWTLICSEAK